MSKQKEIESQIEAVDKMVRALEEASDPMLRANAKELVSALMALHGACLERMMEVIGKAGAAGKSIIESFARDEMVRSVLLLYGLHPVELKTRVLEALAGTSADVRSQGSVSFVSLDEAGVLTLRVETKAGSCQSTGATLKHAIEQAVYEAAPDITGIVMEGYSESTATGAFVPLATLAASGHPALQESS
jgi:Fe-S cluster biogenesis protein NfuA